MRYLQKNKDTPNLYDDLQKAKTEAENLRGLILAVRSEWRLGNLDCLADFLAGPPPQKLCWDK